MNVAPDEELCTLYLIEIDISVKLPKRFTSERKPWGCVVVVVVVVLVLKVVVLVVGQEVEMVVLVVVLADVVRLAVEDAELLELVTLMLEVAREEAEVVVDVDEDGEEAGDDNRR